jgi:hypothetical protein
MALRKLSFVFGLMSVTNKVLQLASAVGEDIDHNKPTYKKLAFMKIILKILM